MPAVVNGLVEPSTSWVQQDMGRACCLLMCCCCICCIAASVPLPAYTSYDNLVYLTTAELAPGPGTGCGAKASSKDACALRCAATPYCKVFVYVGAGCSGSCCQACYLKYSVDLTYVYTPQPVAEKYSVGIMPGRCNRSSADY